MCNSRSDYLFASGAHKTTIIKEIINKVAVARKITLNISGPVGPIQTNLKAIHNQMKLVGVHCTSLTHNLT